MSEIKSLKEIVETLLECNYECEAGPLKNNKDFRLLAKMAGVELPKSVGEGVVDLKKAFENMAHSIANNISYTSDQRRRDEIVAKAKRDVEELKTARNLLGVRGYPYKDKLVTFADFIVNKDKRTVDALLRFQDEREVLSRGIAKCHPNDCFNVHIGKAIALRRALGLEVPAEYYNAPQPTEVRVGDVVTFPGGINKRVLYRVDDTEKKEDNLTIVRCDVAPSLVGKKANADFTNRDSMLPVVDDSRE